MHSARRTPHGTPRARSLVRIRPYSAADLRFVVQGLDQILAEKARASRHHEITPESSWGRSYAAWILPVVRKAKGVAVVAMVEGDRAGFAFGIPDRGIPRWMLRSGAFSRRCSVLEVYVVPRFRSRGLGPRLVAEIGRCFSRQGYDWITASYHAGHRFEAELYRRAGFLPNSVGVARWLVPRRRR